MRQAFVHEAFLVMEPESDEGASVTTDFSRKCLFLKPWQV